MAKSKPAAKLGLDFPLGVHPFSFDTWRFQPQFVSEVDTGAPPDAFFTKGQNWNFPPLNPEAMRSNHYNYLQACLQNVMQYASYLRIDHVMWLNRLFWIPKGTKPQEGAYVRYPTEELYALFCLESHRHKCVLIGEDLGTVPEPVRQTMKQHQLLRMFVGQFENWQSSKTMKRVIPKDSVVSLNTHDMPTFAGFWKGVDLIDRKQMGLLNPRSLQEEREWRLILNNNLLKFLRKEGWLKGRTSLFETLKACLHYLSQSPARLHLINLEDLWLETRPQNVPGTGQERPNWRRKARYGLEQFIKMRKVNQLLRSVDYLRKK
jgi:4-alpha-glucanotransferase